MVAEKQRTSQPKEGEIVEDWPLFMGDYTIGNVTSSVAVVTLASSLEPSLKAAIWGKCMTENLGVERVVANIVSNPHIRYLIVCGNEAKGHLPGDSLIHLYQNGIDDNRRIVGANGAIPYVENLPGEVVERFQEQIELIDLRTMEYDIIKQKVDELENASERYPGDPIIVLKDAKHGSKPVDEIRVKSADAMISDGVYMDSNGVTFEEGTTESVQ
ncbi:MAG: tetrahydromethanopterin S-methyltransferase subunit A [Methermicoccaceae archaeon]